MSLLKFNKFEEKLVPLTRYIHSFCNSVHQRQDGTMLKDTDTQSCDWEQKCIQWLTWLHIISIMSCCFFLVIVDGDKRLTNRRHVATHVIQTCTTLCWKEAVQWLIQRGSKSNQQIAVHSISQSADMTRKLDIRSVRGIVAAIFGKLPSWPWLRQWPALLSKN